MAKMASEQREYLWSRLRAAQRAQEIPYAREAEEPPHIAKARSLIARWQKAREAKRERVNANVQKRLDAAKEVLHAGDYAKALDAVKRFESGK